MEWLVLNLSEFGTYYRSVSVCQNRKVITLDVQKSQDYVFPTITRYHIHIFLPAVFIKRIRRINYVQENVVPESLECRDRKWYLR